MQDLGQKPRVLGEGLDHQLHCLEVVIEEVADPVALVHIDGLLLELPVDFEAGLKLVEVLDGVDAASGEFLHAVNDLLLL